MFKKIKNAVSAAYKWLWQHTTGEPYTDIMRRHPWLLLSTGSVLLVILGTFLPFTRRGRVVYIIAGFVVFFVAGHVFW